MKTTQLAQLTTDNAHLAKTIINAEHPEWGAKQFNHNSELLTDGTRCSSWGLGSDSAILSEHEFRFWRVASWH